jgi:mycofactocin precursor
MTHPNASTDEHRPDRATTPPGPPARPSAQVEPAPLVEEELLVEEISIDGMCGVY